MTYTSGNFYHLYNRGVNRHNIFFKPQNWTFFLTKVQQYFKPQWVDVCAYCLMPNHYHLLVYLKEDDVLSFKIMQPFGTSYTKAINRQENRVGPLFQGRFKGKLISSRDHLLKTTAYIHDNPVKAGFVDRPRNWIYSSVHDYLKPSPEAWIDTRHVKACFRNSLDYERWLQG